MSDIKIKRPDALLSLILKRQLMCDYVSALREQPSPFKRDAKIVVIGSAIPMLEGEQQPNALPHLYLPGDLDLYLYQPQKSSGKDTESKMQSLIKNTATALGCHRMFTTGGLINEGNATFEIKKYYTPDEIQQILDQPSSKKLLERITGTHDIDFSASTTNPAEVGISVQYLMHDMSFRVPKRFHNVPATAEGNVEVLRDSTLNMIGLKLARLMLEPRATTFSGHYHKASDLISICDELALRHDRGKPLPDIDTLKVLTLAHLAYLSKHYTVDAMRTCPEFSGYYHDQTNLDSMIKQAHQESIFVSPNVMKNMLTEANTLIEAMFPGRVPNAALPLSKDEQYFMDNIFINPKRAVSRLAAAHPEVFKKDSGLKDRILNMHEIKPEKAKRGQIWEAGG